MTAEIAILTRSAVAMAADSAATYGRGKDIKVFPSANKIFALSKRHPVGIMIYGNAEFMGLPWETIIKHYRDTLGSNTFENLSDFATAFTKFVASEPSLVSPEQEWEYAKVSVFTYLSHLVDSIRNSVKNKLEQVPDLPTSEIPKIVDQILQMHEKMWESSDEIPGYTATQKKTIRRNVEKFTESTMPQIFEKLLTPKQAVRVKKFAANVLLLWPHDITNDGTSGIVVAGFGEKDLFPSLRSYQVLGRLSGHLQFNEHKEHSINISRTFGEAIVPLAQTDVAMTFLEGVAPEYQSALERGFKNILERIPQVMLEQLESPPGDSQKKAMLKTINRALSEEFKKYRNALANYRHARYVQPVLEVLNGLPKDELASVAESLVSLTSLKRRISFEHDSVGGPIDVAVISRGDGFIWMRRKHYFNSTLNHHFFANYYNKETI